MAIFECVTPEQFAAALAESPCSRTLRDVLARLELSGAGRDANCVVHRGTLKLPRRFSPPAFNVLLIGDLIVDGMADAHYAGADEGGCFIVIGDVTCDVFANDYAKATLIDGDINAAELILNAYEDSGLWVTGNLKTNFFFGEDVWAEVGGTAEMAYGHGYCLPIGYCEASRETMRPRHDVVTSLRQLNLADTSALDPMLFKKMLLRGDQLFK